MQRAARHEAESGRPQETGDAFERYQVRLRATARLEVQIFQPTLLLEEAR
jgi:hypothetical protein